MLKTQTPSTSFLLLCSLLGVIGSSCATHLMGQRKVAASSDGVEFQLVPIDISQNCTANILKGTQRFKGTAFVMPKVLLSQDTARVPLLEIFPSLSDPGNYILRMGLWFPHESTAADEARKGTDHLTQNQCNFAEIKDYLSRQGSGADAINNIAPLPIKSLEVRIDGLEHGAHVGGANTAVLDYFGRDVVIEMKASKVELYDLMRRMRGRIGINLNLDLIFGARSSDGYVKATLDSQKLSTQLDAALSAKFPVHAVMAQTDLRAVLQSTLETMKTDIYVEAGQSTDINEIANKLAEQIMSQVRADDPHAVTEPGAPLVDPNSGNSNNNNNNNGQNSSDSSGYGYGNNGGSATTQPTPAPVSSLPVPSVSVAAVLKAAKAKRTWEITYTRLGQNEDQRYSTSLVIRADMSDPTVVEEQVRTGSPATYGAALEPGNDLTLFPVSRQTEDIDYIIKKDYYSKRQLIENLQVLQSYFPYLTANDKEKYFKEIEAAGEMRAYIYEASKINIFDWKYRMWGESKPSELIKATSDEMPIDPAQALEVPLTFTFSKLGSRHYNFHDISTTSNYWDSAFDAGTGRITFRPKTVLGVMQIFNEEKLPTRIVESARFFEERWTTIRAKKLDGSSTSNNDHKAMPTQRSNYLMRMIAEDNSVIKTTIEPATSSDGVLVAPRTP